MADKAGLNLETVGYAISKGAAASPQVTRNSERMIAGEHENNIVFSGRWRLKDTIYGIRLAEKFGQNPRLGKIAGDIYEMLTDTGYGEQNESKIIDVIRKNN